MEIYEGLLITLVLILVLRTARERYLKGKKELFWVEAKEAADKLAKAKHVKSELERKMRTQTQRQEDKKNLVS